jgi:cysteinyl-tRNA synthetase
MKYLGDTIDIAGGGSDLIFPHHESSIAQSEAVTGKQFVNCWMHTAMINYKGSKMSKKSGNLFLVKDLKDYDFNVVRLFLLSHFYRNEWEFDLRDIAKFNEKYGLFRKALNSESEFEKKIDISSFKNSFFNAMNDDFNIPKAIEILEFMSRSIIENPAYCKTNNAKSFLSEALSILGLKPEYF